MSRQKLLRQLEQFLAGEHSAQAQKIIDFVQREENCFSRTCLEGHVTGSCWLLNPTSDKALLTHHRKLNMWLQLGGHTEDDTDMLQVALREAREESGIHGIKSLSQEIFDVDVHTFPERPGEPEHFHYDIRFLLQADSETYQVSKESKNLGWFSFQEIINMETDESVKRMARKSLDMLAHFDA